MPLASQKTDPGLTMGLLKIVNKEVRKYQTENLFDINR